jgi:hypothetical protein
MHEEGRNVSGWGGSEIAKGETIEETARSGSDATVQHPAYLGFGDQYLPC